MISEQERIDLELKILDLSIEWDLHNESKVNEFHKYQFAQTTLKELIGEY